MNKRLILAGALWLASICLMVAADFTNNDDFGRTSVLLAIMATMPTIWLMMECTVIHQRRKGVRDLAEAIGRERAAGRVRHLR